MGSSNAFEYAYERARGLLTGDAAVFRGADGEATFNGSNLQINSDNERQSIEFLHQGGVIRLGLNRNGGAYVGEHSALDAGNIHRDISSTEQRNIMSFIDRAMQNNRVTGAEMDTIRSMVTNAIDSRSLAEARGEGFRISPTNHANAELSNGVYVTQAQNGSLETLRVQTELGSVNLSTISGVEARVVTDGDRVQSRDVSANISQQEISAIQRQFGRQVQDGFLSNSELHDLGNMTTQAVNTTAAQDRSQGGR